MNLEITNTHPVHDPHFKFQVGDKVIARSKTIWKKSGYTTITGIIIAAHRNIETHRDIEGYHIMTEYGQSFWADVGCVYKPT